MRLGASARVRVTVGVRVRVGSRVGARAAAAACPCSAVCPALTLALRGGGVPEQCELHRRAQPDGPRAHNHHLLGFGLELG